MKAFLNKVFKLDENKTTVRAELIGGLTTFFAMCYIIIVNPNQMIGFSFDVPGATAIWNACFVGGIISAVIATLCMAFIANKPFALAAGMGLNSFFFVSFLLPCIISSSDLTNGYQAGLAVILVSGVIFLLLSVTKLRSYIATALPKCLKVAIPAGIGLFIAFIGFKNGGVVVANQYTFVGIADLTKWENVPAFLITFIGLIIIVSLHSLAKYHPENKVLKMFNNFGIILAIVVCTALYYAFGLKTEITTTSIGQTFKDWVDLGLVGAFKGFKFAFDGQTIGSIFTVVMALISFTLVDMFDTLGTVYGTAAAAGQVDENGDPLDLDKVMLCDAIGTAVGAATGCSTITTFVESASGVAAGARTGLASLVTAVLFLVCLFLAPVAQYVPTIATAPALIFVGVLMVKNIAKMNFEDLSEAVPGFLAFIIMPLTYSISNGIMVGAISYTIIRLFTGKYSKNDIVVTIIAVISVLRFAFVTM